MIFPAVALVYRMQQYGFGFVTLARPPPLLCDHTDDDRGTPRHLSPTYDFQ